MMPFAPVVAADEEQGPRGRYKKTARTRERILDAALEVFGENGFESGSLRQVAERAGISQAGLLHHYPSKVALLSAVIERRDERASVTSLAHSPGAHQIRGVLDFARASAELPFEIDLFAVLSAEATRPDHPANAYMRRRYAWVSDVFERTFEAMAAAGQLRDGVDPMVSVSQFIALWDGLQIQWLLRVGDVNIADRLELFMNQLLVRPLAELLAESPDAPATVAVVDGAVDS